MNTRQSSFLMASGLLATVIALLLTGCDASSRPAAYSRAPSNAEMAQARAQIGGASLYETGSARAGQFQFGGAADARESQVRQWRAATPAGGLPGLDEEVWVIAKAESRAAGAQQPVDDEVPGCGAMLCRIPDAPAEKHLPMPLKHTSVSTRISAYIASVNVTQQFHNPYDGKIEAIYVFPLPANAAINGFVMTIGERRIRGILREREQAEQIYSEARAQGYVASLLTQERPNVFTQAVANIESGARVDVDITYFHTLSYDDGWYEYVLPMVVGPRFNPPGFTDGIGAVPSVPAARSGRRTDVHYIEPHERSGHDISLEVAIEAGVEVEDIRCLSHDVEITGEHSSQVTVALAEHDRIPNKDFVLRYRIAGDDVRAALLATRTKEGGFFTLMLYPPADLDELERSPVEMVYVIDTSGSMAGEPIRLARDAVQASLRQLQPQDTFQVIRFSNATSQFGRDPAPASRENINRALGYVRSLHADGGTMMLHGLRAALDLPHDEGRVRFVVFLTDGYIGNEREILDTIQQGLGETHIFSFGIGSSPNQYLLERMAKLGRGVVAHIGLRRDAGEVMAAFTNRIAHPAMTNLEIDWGGLQVTDVLPQRLPDLFVGRPVILAGRFECDDESEFTQRTVRVRGDVAGHRVETQLPLRIVEAAEHEALPVVWARAQIADMMDRISSGSQSENTAAIRQLALDYDLMSAFTAFVAVDSSRITQGDHGTTVPVAVPVPEGVRYETTVASSPLGQ